LAKTDKLDAAILADFGRRMQPAPTPAPHRLVQQLGALVARRHKPLTASQTGLAKRSRSQVRCQAVAPCP
jgi:transposase